MALVKEYEALMEADKKREQIREGIAIKLSIYAREAAWSLMGSSRKQGYLDQALAIMEYEDSQGVVLKVEGELPVCGISQVLTGNAQAIGCPYFVAGYVAVESLIKEG